VSAPRIDADAEAFGDAAGDYEHARPSYPPEAVAILQRELGIGPGARVCDVGAGTGKLTRLLLATGADVVAVEPVAGMREQLTAVVPGVEAHDGTAEALPFPDGSFDAVTVAQAFHWFRFDEALAEIRRVLRPGGGLAILFNQRDERVEWVREWNEAIAWHSRRMSYYEHTDWAAVLDAQGYRAFGRADVEWSQAMTRELVAARIRSVSYIAAMDAAGQQVHVDRVQAIVAGFAEPFDLPYVTRVYWASTS